MKIHYSAWGVAASLLISSLTISVAQAAAVSGDPLSGRAIVVRSCSDCHVVSQDPQKATTDGAPPFAAVANDPTTTELGLRAFLQTPHANMPNLSLSRPEMNDIISYILSLRRK